MILATIWICSCGQRSKSITGTVSIDLEAVDSTNNDNRQLSPIRDLDKYIYTDTTYTTSSGEEITIQNSFPKGGSIEPDGTQYFDSTGKEYALAVFWTRIINKTTTAIEIKINFPADSFAMFSTPDSYLKLFLPTNTMTFDKLSSFNYGISGLKTFLDTNFNKATTLEKTINPNEEYVFYTATLSYQAGGTPRAAIVLKEQDLYYRISIVPHGSATIPCGRLRQRR